MVGGGRIGLAAHAPNLEAECVLYCFLQGMVGGGPHGVGMVPGWLPVAWGRGCLLIGNSDKPLPEGEEEGWKRNLPKPLTP